MSHHRPVRQLGVVLNEEPIRAFAVSVAVLVVMMVGLGFLTAVRRRQLRGVMNREDVPLNPGSEVVQVEPEGLARVKRAHQNLLENAVPFIGIGAIFVATAPSVAEARVLCATFVISRLAHSGFYLAGLQPWRTASFIVGALVQLTMAFEVLRAASR